MARALDVQMECGLPQEICSRFGDNYAVNIGILAK